MGLQRQLNEIETNQNAAVVQDTDSSVDGSVSHATADLFGSDFADSSEEAESGSD